jgi:hypothetical protein
VDTVIGPSRVDSLRTWTRLDRIDSD